MQLCLLPVFSPTRNRRVPAVSQLGETELKMEKAEGLLGGKFLLKRQNDGTIVKTKLYVAFVKLNLAITEAALSAVFTSECARMRPVIGLVACHSKCSQPIRGGAQEAGKNSLFCLQLQREAEEMKYT